VLLLLEAAVELDEGGGMDVSPFAAWETARSAGTAGALRVTAPLPSLRSRDCPLPIVRA